MNRYKIQEVNGDKKTQQMYFYTDDFECIIQMEMSRVEMEAIYEMNA